MVDSDDDRYDAAEQFVTKYLNVKHDCENINDCFASKYTNTNGDSIGQVVYSGAYCAKISTGASVCVRPSAEKDTPVSICVDTNGTERPNIVGRDFYRFFVYKDGFISDGITFEGNNEELDPWYGTANFTKEDCLNSEYGGGCLYQIMNSEWVMDY